MPSDELRALFGPAVLGTVVGLGFGRLARSRSFGPRIGAATGLAGGLVGGYLSILFGAPQVAGLAAPLLALALSFAARIIAGPAQSESPYALPVYPQETLRANRAGRLTLRQRLLLCTRGLAKLGIDSGIVVILVVMTVASPGSAWHALGRPRATQGLLVLLLALVMLAVAGYRDIRGAIGGRVRHVAGKVRTHQGHDWMDWDLTVSRHSFGGFDMSHQLFTAVRKKGGSWRIYYLPGGDRVISLEPIDSRE